jgi:predicted TIM-barrel fold metal-dependent hydrolase
MTQTDLTKQPEAGDVSTSERVMIISSDGHATARMPDYRPYLPKAYHDEFDAFCERYEEEGSRNFDPPNLLNRTDQDVVDAWASTVVVPGLLEGNSDPSLRLDQMDRDGLAAEVCFPDFGLPFELYPPLLAAMRGYTRSAEQIAVANQAYNRWLADFCRTAPNRFAGIAAISFHDVAEAVKEIRWAHNAGLKGVLLPMFDESVPVFDPVFGPIWDALEEYGMPVQSHSGMSSITNRMPTVPSLPHPACSYAIFGPRFFFECHQLLSHFIWGGVLERHPKLQLVLTEQGSGWVIGELQNMDYTFDGSFLRRDIREVVKLKPSDYFARQCHLGSSIFSRAEVQARGAIGVDKIMLGMDYPHHEGTWWSPSTLDYLQATLGAAQTPADEARAMLGGTAARLFGLDTAALAPIVERIGPGIDDVLTPPTEDRFPRGDVHKPLGHSFG